MCIQEADQTALHCMVKKKYGNDRGTQQSLGDTELVAQLNSFEDVDLPLADGPGPPSVF